MFNKKFAEEYYEKVEWLTKHFGEAPDEVMERAINLLYEKELLKEQSWLNKSLLSQEVCGG